MEDNVTACSRCTKISENFHLTFSCKHSFCPNCLYESIFFDFPSIMQQCFQSLDIRLTCSFCKENSSTISPTQLHEIIKDSFINTQVKASIYCVKHKKPAEVYCTNCMLWFCHECRLIHSDLGWFDEHILSSEVPISYGKCINHQKEREYFCKDCNEFICIACTALTHNRHQLELNAEYIEKLKAEAKMNCPFEFNVKQFTQIFDQATASFQMQIFKDLDKLIVTIDDSIQLLERLKQKIKSHLNEAGEVHRSISNLLKDFYLKFYNELDLISQCTDVKHLLFLNQSTKKNFLMEIKSNINTNIFHDLDIIKDSLAKLEMVFKIDFSLSPLRDIEGATEYVGKCIATITEHTDSVFTLLLLPDGRFAAGSRDRTIKIFDPKENFQCVKTLTGHANFINALILLEDGRMASASGDFLIKIWDPKDNFRCTNTLEGHSDYVRTLFQLNNSMLASGANDNLIKIWNMGNGFKCIHTLNGHSSYVRSLLQLQDKKLVSGGCDSSIRIWNTAKDFELLKVINAHQNAVWTLLLLKNGKFASGSWDETIKVWDPSDEYKCVLNIKHCGMVLSLVLLPNDRVASGSDTNTITIWDIKDNFKCIDTITGHSNFIRTLIVLPDGKLVSGSDDTTIKVWI